MYTAIKKHFESKDKKLTYFYGRSSTRNVYAKNVILV